MGGGPRAVVEAVFGLSKLGRLQVVILLLNVFAPLLAINLETAFADPLYLLIGAEFVAFSLFGIVYTVVVENTYAFYSLIFLQLQVCAYVTACSTVGVLANAAGWLRWGIMVWCWVAIITFMVLQKLVRRSWGWHAWSYAGANPQHLQLYQQYQLLSASTVVDAFHAVLFSSAQFFLKNDNWWEDFFVISVAVATLLTTRPLQLAMRREKPFFVIFFLLLSFLGFVVYTNFAVRNTVKLARGEPLSRRSESLQSTLGEAYVIVAIEYCAVLVRWITIVAIANGTTSFGHGLASFFPTVAGARDQPRYLIDPAEHVNQRTSMFSLSSSQVGTRTTGADSRYGSLADAFVVPVSPNSRAKVIDATSRTISVAKPPSNPSPTSSGTPVKHSRKH